MKPSIERLRKSYNEYCSAKQARYDELAYWDAYDSGAFELHKKVADRIDLEERACEYESRDKIYISVGHYIIGDELWLQGFGESDKKLFDLS